MSLFSALDNFNPFDPFALVEPSPQDLLVADGILAEKIAFEPGSVRKEEVPVLGFAILTMLDHNLTVDRWIAAGDALVELTSVSPEIGFTLAVEWSKKKPDSMYALPSVETLEKLLKFITL